MTFGGDRTLSRGRLDLLLASYAELLDSFHRQALAGPRWLDKTVEWRVMHGNERGVFASRFQH